MPALNHNKTFVMMNDHLTKNMIDYMTEITRLFPHYDNKGRVDYHASPVGQPKASCSTTRPILAASTSSFTPNTSMPFAQWNAPAPRGSSTPISSPDRLWGQNWNTSSVTPRHLYDENRLPSNYKWIPESEIFSERQKMFDTSPTASYEHDAPMFSYNRENVPPVQNIQPTFPPQTYQTKIFTPRANLHAQNYRARASNPNHSPPSPSVCSFCKKNGETASFYSSHALKSKIDGRIVVTCPVLRSHVCSVCGATESNAHTLTYCPMMRSRNQGQPLQSTTIALKSTKIKSNGKRRY